MSKNYLAGLLLLAVIIPIAIFGFGRGKNILGSYYIDNSSLVSNSQNAIFDENGVWLVDYGGAIGRRYNPASIAQYALGNYDLFLKTSGQKEKDAFLRQADWLEQNLKIEGDFGVWQYEFDLGKYDQTIKAPWVSALAQGQGISVLARAWSLTGNGKYLDAARMALKSFNIPLEQGGVSYRDENGEIWYEEYPSDPPSHVLNGFIFSLLGIYDLYKISPGEETLKIFNEGVKTVENNLARYDTGCWSGYDLWNYKDGKSYLFRFSMDGARTSDSHPIDRVSLWGETGSDETLLAILDVGAPDDAADATVSGARIYPFPAEDWGESHVLDGRTARNYENRDGELAQAPFDLKISAGDFLKYRLEVVYKDTSREPVNADIFIKGKYQRLGQLRAEDDDAWKTAKIEVPACLLRGNLVNGDYQNLHVRLLESLYQVTRQKVFLDYSGKFGSYLKNDSL